MLDTYPHYDIVILCQGEQTRLADLATRKQLLPLPACGNVPILARTHRQIVEAWSRVAAPLDAAGRARASIAITVVGWAEICTAVKAWRLAPTPGMTSVYELGNPGNSSVVGLRRYFVAWPPRKWVTRQIVLLGDVVYSWDVIEVLMGLRDAKIARHTASQRESELGERGVVVSTEELTPSSGEVWGIAWPKAASRDMHLGLGLAADAAEKPSFTTYQPGQMRTWLWQTPGHRVAKWAPPLRVPMPASDYTRDIDLPEHVAELGQLSELARTDDFAHGVTYP